MNHLRQLIVVPALVAVSITASAAWHSSDGDQSASLAAALPFATQEYAPPCGYCEPDVGSANAPYIDDWCGTGQPAQVSTTIVIHRGTCNWMVVPGDEQAQLDCRQRFPCPLVVTRTFSGIPAGTSFDGWVRDANGDRHIQPQPQVPANGVDVRTWSLACGSELFTWFTRVSCPQGGLALEASASGRCLSCP
jgi:hypothetical protein